MEKSVGRFRREFGGCVEYALCFRIRVVETWWEVRGIIYEESNNPLEDIFVFIPILCGTLCDRKISQSHCSGHLITKERARY